MLLWGQDAEGVWHIGVDGDNTVCQCYLPSEPTFETPDDGPVGQVCPVCHSWYCVESQSDEWLEQKFASLNVPLTTPGSGPPEDEMDPEFRRERMVEKVWAACGGKWDRPASLRNIIHL